MRISVGRQNGKLPEPKTQHRVASMSLRQDVMPKMLRKWGYREQQLSIFADVLEETLRAPEIPGVEGLPRVELVDAVNALNHIPDTYKESLEYFFALQGGPCLLHMLNKSIDNDPAMEAKRQDALAGLRMLTTVKCAAIYDQKVLNWLIEKIVVEHVDTTGCEGWTNIKIAQFLIIFWFIIKNGPRFEKDENILSTMHDHLNPNETLVLVEIYLELRNTKSKVNLQLIKEIVGWWDMSEKVQVMKNFGLMCEETESEETHCPEFKSIADIRAFKEDKYRNGAWSVVCNAAMGNELDFHSFLEEIDAATASSEEQEEDVQSVAKISDTGESMLSKPVDYKKVFEPFETGKKQIQLKNRTVTVTVYTIAGYEFSDIEEILFLCLWAKHHH